MVGWGPVKIFKGTKYCGMGLYQAVVLLAQARRRNSGQQDVQCAFAFITLKSGFPALGNEPAHHKFLCLTYADQAYLLLKRYFPA